MASSSDDLEIIMSCLVIGGVLLYKAIDRHRKMRKVVDTPRSKINSAAQGFVEFEGFAWPASGTFVSTNGADAVYYTFDLQKEVTTGSGKNKRTEWISVYSYSFKNSFYVIDATGVAMVDPLQGEMNIGETQTRMWNALGQKEQDRILTGVINGSVDSFPPSKVLFGLFASRFRTVESELCVGAPVYVNGDFRTTEQKAQKISSPGLSAFAKKVFNAGRNIKDATAVLDTDRDGKVSAAEAKAGYSTAARMARTQAKLGSGPVAEQEFEMYGRLGSSASHQLFVADAFESQLVGRLGNWLWLHFAGGALLIAAGLSMGIYRYMPEMTSSPARKIACSLGSKDRCLPAR